MAEKYYKKDYLIECRNVSVNLPDRQILKDISLKIKPKQIVTLVGPNGGGKTTLAKAIIGIVKPSEGRVFRKHHLSIGYVPQRFSPSALIPITVYNFLHLNNSFSKEQLEQIVDLLVLGEVLKNHMHLLSGGQLQKVLLARALLKNPELLILDEPTQGIDISGQFEFYNFIATLRKRNDMSILMISHDLHVVMRSCDEVICLNTHVCCRGHPSDISKDPEYERIFSRDALSSIGIYNHQHDHVHDEVGHVHKL